MSSASKKRLSKHLLEMKFMKTSRERIQREDEEEQCRSLFSYQLSDELKTSSSKYIIEPSWVKCEGLKCGRRAFRGANPTIEKIMLMEEDNKYNIPKIKTEEDVDVTAEEMARVYKQESTLVETMAKKFQSRNNPSNFNEPPRKKVKFMKPPED